MATLFVPREKQEPGLVAELIKMYLMQSIGSLMDAPVQEAAQKRSMLTEFGTEVKPEQAGALEQELFPGSKNSFFGLFNKKAAALPEGQFVETPAAAPSLRSALEPGPIESDINPPQNVVAPKTMVQALPKESFLSRILQPTERGTYKLPGRVERETAAVGERARLEEAAKEPARIREEAGKTKRAEEAVAAKDVYYDILDKHYKDMKQYYDDQLTKAREGNESKERMNELNQRIKELQQSHKDLLRDRELDIKQKRVEVEEERVKKIGQAGESEVIKKFENQMVNAGYMTVDKKNNKLWRPLTTEESAAVEQIAQEYGFTVDWTERWNEAPLLGKIGKSEYIPKINYNLERPGAKAGEKAAPAKATPGKAAPAAVKPKELPKIQSQEDVKAAIDAANKAIANGQDPKKVKERLRAMGIEVK